VGKFFQWIRSEQTKHDSGSAGKRHEDRIASLFYTISRSEKQERAGSFRASNDSARKQYGTSKKYCKPPATVSCRACVADWEYNDPFGKRSASRAVFTAVPPGSTNELPENP
jgi:hypothetical protein